MNLAVEVMLAVPAFAVVVWMTEALDGMTRPV